MASKLSEYTVVVNGVETTMLLDQDDAERYRKAKVLRDKAERHEPSGVEIQEKPTKQAAPQANK